MRLRWGLLAAAALLLLALAGTPAAGSPSSGGRAEARGDGGGGDYASAEAARPRCRGKARGRRAHIRRARARCARIRRLVVPPRAPERLTPGVTAPGDPPPGETPDDPGDPGTPPPPPPRFASVAAREWSLTLSRPLVGAGNVTIELQNAGEDPHNLIVSPDDGSHDPLAAWDELLPGENARRTVSLSAGRYYLWCSLEGHEAAGMSVRLRVE